MDYIPTPPESPSGDSDTPPPTVAPVGAIVDHGDCVKRMTELEETISSLRGRIDILSNEQIQGSDSRLSDFWQKAQELADRANHCEVYDDIAEALGGPRREREFEVEFTFTQTITVTARDEESAEEYARDMLCNYTADDLYEYEVRVN
jgi:hypothetical protein